MSEDRELNPGWLGSTEGSPQPSSHAGGAIDAERLLQNCLPEVLTFDRDQLFFQAGFAAGSAKRSLRLFWPSAAAAMLLVSIGLGVALHNQARSIAGLETALATAQNMQGATGLATSGATAGSSSSVPGVPSHGDSTVGQASSGTSVDDTDRLFADDRLRHWQRLASPAPLPPGRLTALGWEQLPAEMGNGDWGMGNVDRPTTQGMKINPDSSPPRRPATYLELLRTYGEG